MNVVSELFNSRGLKVKAGHSLHSLVSPYSPSSHVSGPDQVDLAKRRRVHRRRAAAQGKACTTCPLA
jgi:hypothetical protein